MSELVMNNVKEKLSKSREMCENMSERAYLLADYMSEIVDDTISPSGLADCLSRAVEDTYQERWREGTKNDKLREAFVLYPKLIRNQAVNIPRIIDAVADEDFAEEFRSICKERFGFDPPKSSNTKLKDYPESVQVAAMWWTVAIFDPNTFAKLTTPGSSLPSSIAAIVAASIDPKSYSKDELIIFALTLAEEIMERMNAWGNCTVSVDYHPDEILKAAGNKIKVPEMFGYPLRTHMTIWKYKVEVKVGDGAEFVTLWTEK